MYLPKKVSKLRLSEAKAARKNRLDIVKALSQGEVTRRELFKWGIFTTTGLLALKNGLSPYAKSAYAQVPTGTPPSPSFGAQKFTMPMPRVVIQQPIDMNPLTTTANSDLQFGNIPITTEFAARRMSYHQDFTDHQGTAAINPVTGRGPVEGRPPGEFFAHQRWAEYTPKVGYLLSLGQVAPGSSFHPNMPEQEANSVWSYGTRPAGFRSSMTGSRTGSIVPPLIRLRYGEPALCRIYNDLPVNRAQNNGFGRNEISTHFHNAHNGAESDGACNAYHFPGTFYDYLWSTCVARADNPDFWDRKTPNWINRCSGAYSYDEDPRGFKPVPGDFRELQGSMWFHDHRFFFTAENVHKGNFGLINMYSGPDRGAEHINDGTNLRLPSGRIRDWGNVDFDVNLCISNPALRPNGQLFWDIFDTDGFLGDILAVNGAYYPFLEVLPRRYRFRILNASMARFFQLTLVTTQSNTITEGTKVPVMVVSNDGNFLVSPVKVNDLDIQGVAERFDIVVDFSAFQPGDKLQLVNRLQQTDGREPDGIVGLRQAMRGVDVDPAVGPVLELRVVNTLQSVDDPSYTYDMTKTRDRDRSENLDRGVWRRGDRTLTTQIPVVEPVRVREIEFTRGGGDARDTPDGQCVPECGNYESFPWTIKINGENAHSLNANRISLLVPKPGDVEHWILKNGGGGWDHPVHIHFEEAVTIDRDGDPIPATERLARKDVWRLRDSGKRTVRVQLRFGEFGGAYVAHCHNTTHEDFAMLLRYQVLTPSPFDGDYKGQPQWQWTKTPIPTPDGIMWKTPEILPEGDPTNKLAP